MAVHFLHGLCCSAMGFDEFRAGAILVSMSWSSKRRAVRIQPG
jgi:hypothetical protein